MLKTEDNQTRSNQWFIIINKPLELSNGFNVRNIFTKLNSIYGGHFIASIEHFQEKDGERIKEDHIHVVLTTNRMRKGTLINDLGEILRYPLECITVSTSKNLRASCRYLLHLDDDDKQKYPPFMVETNDETFYKSFLIDRIENLSPEELIKVVKEERLTSKIITKIGLENYKRYAIAIRDLQKELA